ncbi:chymotrypsin inhibitor SCI-I-like [Teleopsis dalmanni]|uniref:chymotrypsin inhibitor SCI-I-like n=1 Tax=Teleopsis dalmanni TaxID=139649 RepID=UPI0018CE27C6|nr:chymotrypsin inhibitor SCI-I-like [Teleopsis dalmanni]
MSLFSFTNTQKYCGGELLRPACTGAKDSGHGGLICFLNANKKMWYWNGRTNKCEEMSYKGCGGNKNRYCTLKTCEKKLL